MRKLLIIAPQNPYPATNGGKIGIYYPLVNLANYFQIHFVFTYFKPLPPDLAQHFDNFGIKIYPQRVNTKDSLWGVLLNLLRSRPYKFEKYHKQSVLKNVKGLIRKENIDLIWCNHSHMGWYALQLRKKFKVKIFLREHNIEYSLVQQVLKLNKNFLAKTYIHLQYLKTKRHEIDCWKRFDRTFLISDSDFSLAKEECPNCHNFDLLYDSFPEKRGKYPGKQEPYSFIFTGSVDTFQNCHNLQTFITMIWEPLVKADPRWKLYLTGSKDDVIKKKIKSNLSERNIINLGFVDNIEETIAGKKYFISPTYIGSGLRIKVLNAMAGGAVCFVTRADANMLSVFGDFDNIVKFNNFNEFYRKLMLLESDELLYNSISLHALEVGTDFTWKDYALKVLNEITRI